MIYYKNKTVGIESCQFRNGKSYLIKIRNQGVYKSNCSVILKMEEIKMLKSMGMEAKDLFKLFSVDMKIVRNPNSCLIEKVYDF
jgi:hypothetical protein